MADAFPKICFAFDDNGDTVRIWGACDRVELTAGISPNAVELAVPKHEFDKFAGNYQRHGNLQLYWSDPDTPDVRLGVFDFDGDPIGGWSVEMVEDTLSGKGVGEANAEVKEKTLTLLDRRWEFTGGLGGHAFAGLVNAKKADGNGVSNPPGGAFAADGATYYSLLYWLTGKLQYATGLPKLDHDFYPPAVAPLTTTKPADLKWDGVNIPQTIDDLLNQIEAVWTLDANGTYALTLIGTGDAPTLPNPLPSESHQLRMTRPSVVVITSAPRPAYNQIAIQGVGPDGEEWDDPALEYVGLDTDGTCKPIADLSYVVPHTIERAVEIVRTRYEGLEGLALGFAVTSLFTMLRLKSAAVHQYLPFIGRLVDTLEDEPGSGRLRPEGPVKILATIAIQDPRGVWRNSVVRIPANPHTVLPREGIFIFDGLLGKVDPNGVIAREANFEPLGYGDLLLTAAAMTHFGDHRDYFCVGYTLVGEVVTELTAEQLVEALGPDSGDCTILSIPELAEHRVAGVGQNTDALKIAAKALAARILTTSQTVERRTHIGFHQMSPNGNIPSVCWNLRDGTTAYEWKAYFFGKNSYIEKQRLREIVRGADAGERTAKTAPVSITEGERDYAPRLWSIGAPSIQLVAGVVRYGKALTAWVNVAGDGSYVDLNPCKRDGSDEDPGVTVRAYIRRSNGGGDPNVVADQVVAYELDIYGDAIAKGCLDAPIGTVWAWNLTDQGTPVTPRQGWEVYVGDGGRTLVSYGDSQPFNTVDATGGQQYHGDGDNDHDSHVKADHPHPLSAVDVEVQSGTGTTVRVFQAGTTQTGDAGGFDLDHSGTNNMPPYKVVGAWIRRFDNSYVAP